MSSTAEPIDLAPAAERLLTIVDGVRDEHLGGPTPCGSYPVSRLLAHLVGAAGAFRAAAEKDLGPWTDTSPDAAGWPELEPGWRDLLRERVPALVGAWRSHDAWQGMTRAGGVDLPGAAAGLVALDELVLHGWDLARATGQAYDCDEATARALLGFVSQFDPAGTPGLFGPALEVGEDAPVFDRVLARAGRDPEWAPRS